MSEPEDKSTLFPLAREDEIVDEFGDDDYDDREREAGHKGRVLAAVGSYLKRKRK